MISSMKTAITLLIGVLLGAALTITGYFLFTTFDLGDETITVTFTEEEIQQKIGRKFPKKEKILDYIPIVIQEPIVKFLGDTKRVQLSVDASIAIPFIASENVTGVFTSSLRYEKDDQTLRISDLTVENISTSSLPSQFEEPVRAALTIAARQYLDDYTVYTLKKKDYKGKMAELLLKKIKVKNGRLEVILGI